MKPFLEKIRHSDGASWAFLDRRLDDGIPFEWHHHPEYELTLTVNSRGHRYVGDHIGAYDDGDLVLLGPSLAHSWASIERLDESAPHRALVVQFTEDWARSLTALFVEMAALRALLLEAGRAVLFSRDTARAVRPDLEALPDLQVDERLVRLLSVLSRLTRDGARATLASPRNAPVGASDADRSRIDKVLEHLHAHHAEPVAIAELAEIACLSESALHRMFRRHTRLTPLEYLTQLRVGHACSLLIGTDRPIGHIAGEVGFRNLALFNRTFRWRRAMTPREFRTAHRRGHTAIAAAPSRS
jgi:AraC-like DNA-binding protein